MLRDIIVNGSIAVDATYSADVEMKTGMGVIKDFATGKAKLPTSATAENVCFVAKNKVVSGINTARKNISDYDNEVVTVKAGEKLVCYDYPNGNDFGTDQFDTSITSSDAGKAVVVGTDGKIALATSTTTSRYQFIGFFTDNGHTLARIHVLDTPIANGSSDNDAESEVPGAV